MSTNLTDEIRAVEAAAARTVSDAKAEAMDLVAKTRNAAMLRVKEGKQADFRGYRKRISLVEAEAEKKSAKVVEEGSAAAAEFIKAHEAAVKKTAQWLAEEVVSRYGRC